MSKFLDQNGLLYFKTKIETLLAGKVDKADGMGLSANDYTTEEKTKLAGIAEGATKTVINNTLTSTASDEALSAAQGKVLKDGLDAKLEQSGDASNTNVTFTTASVRENLITGEKLTVIVGKIAKYFADLKTVAYTGSYSDLTDKPTISNDLTDELKAQYDAAYAHSQTAHAPSDAQANVIEKISVNGTAQSISNKAVNITVPTTVSQLSDADNYALKTDITNVYKYQGSVATVDDLPATSTPGYVYNVESDGMNYAYTEEGTWDNLGSIFEVEEITNAEIDAIFA